MGDVGKSNKEIIERMTRSYNEIEKDRNVFQN